MTDPTPSTPQTLSGRALDIAVAKLLGYAVGKNDGSDWYYLIRPDGSENYCHVSKIESKVWNDVPRFTRSLDACAPLIEEVNNEGYEIVITFQDAVVAQYVHCAIYLHRYDQNGIEEDCSIICDETLKYEPLHSAATALCLAYHKFKELTTEVSTANAKTNAI